MYLTRPAPQDIGQLVKSAVRWEKETKHERIFHLALQWHFFLNGHDKVQGLKENLDGGYSINNSLTSPDRLKEVSKGLK